MTDPRSTPGDRADNGHVPGTASSADGGLAALERRYRRLLAWYPADHRRMYGEEMLGVLIAAAAPGGRSRPAFAEAMNLAWSGVRARVRHIGTGTDPRWRDALAVYSLVAPVVATVAIYGDPLFLTSLLWRFPHNAGPLALPYPGVLLHSGLADEVIWRLTIAAPLIPVIFALLRLRRTALILSTWLMIWVAVDAGSGWRIQVPDTIALIVLLATEVAALTMSDGPRRALRLVTWKGVLLVGPWLAIAVVAALNEEALSEAAGGISLGGSVRYYLLLAIVAAAATLVSAKTRRVVLLFTIPAAPFLTWYGSSYPKSTTGMFLVPALLALITFVISRSRRRTGADDSPAIPAR